MALWFGLESLTVQMIMRRIKAPKPIFRARRCCISTDMICDTAIISEGILMGEISQNTNECILLQPVLRSLPKHRAGYVWPLKRNWHIMEVQLTLKRITFCTYRKRLSHEIGHIKKNKICEVSHAFGKIRKYVWERSSQIIDFWFFSLIPVAFSNETQAELISKAIFHALKKGYSIEISIVQGDTRELSQHALS